MGKIIEISERHLIPLKEDVESDKYTIGSEKSAPIGISYSHVCGSDVDENVELEVNASDIDLSSFKKQDKLTSRLWDDDGKLDSRVRLKLLDIADDFWDFVNIKWVKPYGIILTGSICNYNWSSYSDIDLHLIADFHEIDDKTEFVRTYLDSKKNEWNDMHNQLEIRGYKVELYVQDIGEEAESNGIYDLESNEWIKKPSHDAIKPIELNKYPIKDKAADIMTIIDDMYDALSSTDDKHNIEVIGDDASYLWKKIKSMRKKSLDKHGESGNGNIVYKLLRREGYIDKLFDLMSITYDKVNSIDEGVIIKEYLDKNYNAPLVNYFKNADKMSDEDKAIDLAYNFDYLIQDFMNEYDIDDDIDEYDVDAFAEVLADYDMYEEFIRYCERNADDQDLPSWCHEMYCRVVKNEWCIHFGNDSQSIAENGFTSGTDNIEKLGITGRKDNMGVGYNFAYLVNDRNVDLSKYGDEAVIFRTSGVLVYHFGDEEHQVIFWGPYAHDFIPIKQGYGGYDDYEVYGLNGQVLYSGKPSEIANWASTNLGQYRKQILYSKNGIVPKPRKHFYTDNGEFKSYVARDIPKSYNVTYEVFNRNNVKQYLDSVKRFSLNEEVVADGNSEHNPYAKRWRKERQLLKDFLCNYGKVMTSKENGKEYKVYYDTMLSQMIGVNYCICIQWDEVKMKPSSTIYVRALDKFTNRRFNANFDARGKDNEYGTNNDIG